LPFCFISELLDFKRIEGGIFRKSPIFSEELNATHGSGLSRYSYPICHFLNNPSIPSPQFAKIWKLQAPPRIRFFIWLLLHDKLNTADNLLQKGWTATPNCIMCNSYAPESAILFISCPISHNLHVACKLSDNQRNQSLMESWTCLGDKTGRAMGSCRLGNLEGTKQLHLQWSNCTFQSYNGSGARLNEGMGATASSGNESQNQGATIRLGAISIDIGLFS
jgi:zinc-binding in reverse transcriptase